MPVIAMPEPVKRPIATYVLDLETVGIDDAALFCEPSDPPANYKDPEKIADWQIRERAKKERLAAVDLDLARLVVVGWTEYAGAAFRMPTLDAIQQRILPGSDPVLEIAVLEEVRPLLESSRLVTFGGAHFDLPLLQRRYWHLGLAPLQIELERFRSPHVDLYEKLTMFGRVGAHKLEWYARRLGWPTDGEFADPLEGGGANVGKAAAEGRFDLIADHNRADLYRTYRLAQHLSVG